MEALGTNGLPLPSLSLRQLELGLLSLLTLPALRTQLNPTHQSCQHSFAAQPAGLPRFDASLHMPAIGHLETIDTRGPYNKTDL